ncbi:hypothetical protein TRM7557_03672 [Tritonibacter multivorans]|uniref:DUF5666 domain-containing protein n=1 Tax=Tritonibacter multivorans TaxID=928856 RepID=A0A0P1H1H6_9RHOB|nr:DUF5666 domain-containing protein [Tritonibacter multivorans]MDA7421678.1 DUF5666 domain-containing protein [Tritonibacter multivorans]CUH81952.1 hypothetical protein TRM7557_03672 [Tritonibacter multivorans]SFC91782.1 hypothetical protein SAMN04488049_10516 [Tritonibacter multivorans]
MTSVFPNRRFFIAASLCATVLPVAGRSQSRDKDVEGGLGGTGIVGVLVDTGVLRLSGQAVETDASTQASTYFGPVPLRLLQVGDSLTVEATRVADGRLIARRIEVTYPLVGAITALDFERNRCVVNGVDVASERGLRGWRIGDRVAVSGLWRGRSVVASRISTAPSLLDLVSGTTGRRTVGGVPIRRSAVSLTTAGRFATVAGRFDVGTGVMRAERTTLDRFTGAAGTLTTLAIEGWLEPTKTAPGYRIAGLGHSFERNLDLGAFANSRMLFTGPYTGRFAADAAVRLPTDPAARRRLLRRISL